MMEKTDYINSDRHKIGDSEIKVTVVIPTNNRWPLLKKAIDSVKAQTYGCWELMIVDDGSTDGTIENVLAQNDKRIRLIQSANKGNIAALRNEGATAGTGDYFAFLDSDDYWLPAKLERQLAILTLEKKRWAYTNYDLMDENEKFLPHRSNQFYPYSGWVTHPLLQTKTDITICSVMVERSLFNAINGFDCNPEIIHRTDYDLIFRLSVAAEVAVVPEILLQVRDHPNRATNLLNDGHQKSALAFGHIAKTNADPTTHKLARKKMAWHLAEDAGVRIKSKQYRTGLSQLWKAVLEGDQWRHLLSVLKRSLISQ